MLRLVILVVAVTVGPRCKRLVRFVVLIVEFLRAWGISCNFIVYSDLFSVTGAVGRIGCYCYRWCYSSVEILDVSDCIAATYFLGCISYCLYCLICNFLNCWLVRGKNQDFIIMSLVNPSNLIGCGGDI